MLLRSWDVLSIECVWGLGCCLSQLVVCACVNREWRWNRCRGLALFRWFSYLHLLAGSGCVCRAIFRWSKVVVVWCSGFGVVAVVMFFVSLLILALCGVKPMCIKE
jgi:hypothetical protein